MGKMRLPLYTGKNYIHYSFTRKMRLPLYTGKIIYTIHLWGK